MNWTASRSLLKMIGDIEMRLPDYERQRLAREGDANEGPVPGAISTRHG
jgi:hypothetical protein